MLDLLVIFSLPLLFLYFPFLFFCSIIRSLFTSAFQFTHSLFNFLMCWIVNTLIEFLIITAFFNWRILALQCCGSLCRTLAQISHSYPCGPALQGSFPNLSTPLGRHRGPSWAPCAVQQRPAAYPHHAWWGLHVSAARSAHPTSASPDVSSRLFSMSVSIAPLWRCSLALFF